MKDILVGRIDYSLYECKDQEDGRKKIKGLIRNKKEKEDRNKKTLPLLSMALKINHNTETFQILRFLTN